MVLSIVAHSTPLRKREETVTSTYSYNVQSAAAFDPVPFPIGFVPVELRAFQGCTIVAVSLAVMLQIALVGVVAGEPA